MGALKKSLFPIFKIYSAKAPIDDRGPTEFYGPAGGSFFPEKGRLLSPQIAGAPRDIAGGPANLAGTNKTRVPQGIDLGSMPLLNGTIFIPLNNLLRPIEMAGNLRGTQIKMPELYSSSRAKPSEIGGPGQNYKVFKQLSIQSFRLAHNYGFGRSGPYMQFAGDLEKRKQTKQTVTHISHFPYTPHKIISDRSHTNCSGSDL